MIVVAILERGQITVGFQALTSILSPPSPLPAPPQILIHYLGIKYAFNLAPDFNRSQTVQNKELISDKHFQEEADEEMGMMKFTCN